MKRVGSGILTFCLLAVLVTWTTRPPNDWVEDVDQAARRSVVQIKTADGMGTGFVIASQGPWHLLLTNKHVVTVTEGLISRRSRIPDQCQVVLCDGTALRGELVGVAKDPIDLALVLVEANGLRPLGRICPFEQIHVGEKAVAVGHPGVGDVELKYTITEGIVSAKRESLWLQTNAAINHGNSGGPLIGRDWRVLGVNTGILRHESGSDDSVEGVGFAVRADLVRMPEKWTYRPDVTDLLRAIP
jgi:S1-C subfamily serine protease